MSRINDARGRAGRGRGGRGRSGFFGNRNFATYRGERDVMTSQRFKPHNPDLKILHYVEGRTSPEDVESALRDWKTYAMEHYIRGLDTVLDPEGDYPDFQEPDLPDEAGGENYFARKRWEGEFRAYQEDLRKFDADVIKLTGLMLGQMSPESIERVRQDAAGATAIDEKDPRALVQAIRATHYTPLSGGNAGKTLYSALRRWNNLQMGESESVEAYKRRATSELEAVRQAAVAAEEEAAVPSEGQATMHFIMCLASKYSDFKREFSRQRINPMPTNLQEAMDRVIEFGRDDRDAMKAKSSFVLYGGKSKAKGAKQAEKFDEGPIQRNQCRFCRKHGHWMHECEKFQEAAINFCKDGGSKKKEDDDIDKAIDATNKKK